MYFCQFDHNATKPKKTALYKFKAGKIHQLKVCCVSYTVMYNTFLILIILQLIIYRNVKTACSEIILEKVTKD